MAWQQLHIISKATDAPAIETQLLALGALAVSYTDAADQAIFQRQPGELILWEQNKITALFSDDTDLDLIVTALKLDYPALSYTQEKLEDQVWERAWLKDFKPMHFGEKTWICPTGFAPPDPSAINLYLDPGLAFGTGTHQTTALCLNWIDAADLSNKTIIDYGCGSGILALAALKHGAAKVYAIDHDPQALLATRENAARNKIDETRLEIYLPEDFPQKITADLLIANILADPLLALKNTLANLVKTEGHLVLSGILLQQGAEIQTAYEEYFKNFHVAENQDWLLLHAIRRTSF